MSAAEWSRHPEGSTSVNLTERKGELVTISDHAGGLVFVEASGSILQSRIGVPKVQENLDIFALAVFSNCLPSPTYTKDKTTPVEWTNGLKCDSGVLCGELVGKRIILTVPVITLQTIADPQAVIEFWDSVVDHLEDLTFRPEIDSFNLVRIVTDPQLGAESMKRDPYTIAITEADAKVIVTIDELTTTNFKTFWRVLNLVSELFESTLWPRFASEKCWRNTLGLYVCTNFLGMKLDPLVVNDLEIESRPTDFMMPVTRRRAVLVGDRDTALCVLLIRTFGWKGLRKTFAQYARLEKWKSPQNFRERVDTFVCIMSQVATRDMRPFFELWDLHSSPLELLQPHLREVYYDLPKWVPLFDVDPSTQGGDSLTVRQWRLERENARDHALEKAKALFEGSSPT